MDLARGDIKGRLSYQYEHRERGPSSCQDNRTKYLCGWSICLFSTCLDNHLYGHKVISTALREDYCINRSIQSVAMMQTICARNLNLAPPRQSVDERDENAKDVNAHTDMSSSSTRTPCVASVKSIGHNI